jgi:hypothetical protein
MIEKININEIKLNPNNPRIIKDEKFNKLVKSIKEFPEMLDIRPIVIDELGFILGGNMRFKASKDAGLKEISIIRAENLTEEQKNEFIIKDNSNFGDWDWEVLQANWETDDLLDWGLDITTFDTNNNDDDDEDDDNNNDDVIQSNKWYLNIELTSEKECQDWYEKLKIQGLNCKIVQ